MTGIRSRDPDKAVNQERKGSAIDPNAVQLAA
jgi:hypothetical protein